MQHAKGLSAVGFKSPSADSILSVATCCACALGLRFAWYLSLVASIPLRVLRRAAVADVTCSWSGCQRLRKWARARPHPALTALILPNLRMQRGRLGRALNRPSQSHGGAVDSHLKFEHGASVTAWSPQMSRASTTTSLWMIRPRRHAPPSAAMLA